MWIKENKLIPRYLFDVFFSLEKSLWSDATRTKGAHDDQVNGFSWASDCGATEQ